MCIVSVNIALLRWVQKCLPGSKSVSDDEKTGFITERLILNAFFEKYNLRIISNCINVVVILLYVVICAAELNVVSVRNFAL